MQLFNWLCYYIIFSSEQYFVNFRTARKGHEQIMTELLKSVSELKPHPSVIHEAVMHGHVTVVELLLQVYLVPSAFHYVASRRPSVLESDD